MAGKSKKHPAPPSAETKPASEGNGETGNGRVGEEATDEATKQARRELARQLNEEARLYPWRGFDQGELVLMTGYPREAISAAFRAAEFPAHFGCSRPETLVEWIRALDAKITTKNVVELARGKKA